MIEKHVFEMVTLRNLSNIPLFYPQERFIDFYSGDDFIYNGQYGQIMIILSKQTYLKEVSYVNHIFAIQDGLIVWVNRYTVNTNKQTLRSMNPMIDLYGGKYIVYIDQKEKTIIVNSPMTDVVDYVYSASHKIYNAHICLDDHLYLSYYNSSKISPFKIVIYKKEKISYLSLEVAYEIDFKKQYLVFDIGYDGVGTVFFDNNTIWVFQAGKYSEMNYVRELPLFGYKNSYFFSYNSGSNHPTFIRNGQYLYIILKRNEGFLEKYLFIYDLHENSHNTLKSVVPLDLERGHDDNYITIGSSHYKKNICIYIFFGGKHFQFVVFEPFNILKLPDNSNSTLFLPKDLSTYSNYQNSSFVLKIYPDVLGCPQNRTIVPNEAFLNVNATNYGLMINSRVPSRKLHYNEGTKGKLVA